MKTHQLVSKNSLLREAIDFFLYKYIDKMLDDGEKVMNKYFTSKKKDEYLRPNVIIQVSLIDLSWRTSAEESYKRISIKFLKIFLDLLWYIKLKLSFWKILGQQFKFIICQ